MWCQQYSGIGPLVFKERRVRKQFIEFKGKNQIIIEKPFAISKTFTTSYTKSTFTKHEDCRFRSLTTNEPSSLVALPEVYCRIIYTKKRPFLRGVVIRSF